jgi:hypothetical protein
LAQIAVVRATADTSATPLLPIEGAVVTYLKPTTAGASSSDTPGFFLQAEQQGPAIFVNIDPNTVTGGPVAVGDVLSLNATGYGKNRGMRSITTVTGLTKVDAGFNVSTLVQDLSATDIASALDSYDSELMSVSGIIGSEITNAGTNFSGHNLITAGSPDASVQLRLPTPLAVSQDFTPGCTVTVNGTALWRFDTTDGGPRPQPSAFAANEMVSTCPSPKLVNATARNATSVDLLFDRAIEQATLSASGFTVPGLMVLDAGVSRLHVVSLDTEPQDAGVPYVVTVASTVTDTRDSGVDPAANMASFTGFDPGVCAPSVVISQVYGGGGNNTAPFNMDFVELHNRTPLPVSLNNWSLQYQPATSLNQNVAVLPNASIPAGGFFLIGIVGTMDAGQPLPQVDFTINQAFFSLANRAGRVYLANTSTAIANCAGPNLVDAVGYGNIDGGVSCWEGSAPVPELSNTTSATRRNPSGPNDRCVDTNNNGADFSTGAPSPRNSSSPAAACTCP